MAVGRPTDYRPDWMLTKVVDLMAEGCSKTEVAAELGITKETLYQWDKKYPEFSDSLKRGMELCEAWWEKQGRKGLREDKFNATLWYMNMKNRFRWTDKQEQTVEMNANVSFADGVAKARARVEKAKEEQK